MTVNPRGNIMHQASYQDTRTCANANMKIVSRVAIIRPNARVLPWLRIGTILWFMHLYKRFQYKIDCEAYYGLKSWRN